MKKNLAIQIIEKCENINNLLNTDELENKVWELMDKYDNDGIEYEECDDACDCIFNAFTNNRTAILLDGTRLLLTNSSSNCFECKHDNMFGFYYYVPDIDVYICLECGAWLKYHTDLFNKVYNKPYNRFLFYTEKLLPVNWSDIDVTAYFINGIEYLRSKEDKHLEEYLNQI